MRELPILFNTQMVQAILSGQKTVTRRPLKHKPLPKVSDVLWVRERWTYGIPQYWHPYENSPADIEDIEPVPLNDVSGSVYFYAYDDNVGVHNIRNNRVGYISENHNGTDMLVRWRPSIHMPRKYARLFLSVDSVTQENVLDVTEADAVKEGFGSREEFLKVWRKIYGPDETMCHVIRFRWLK